ncbi:MAG: glycosyltransferase family 39 protein, partial [Anaerolineaceae bacterium]|nr:glycosyltransferase family 39 protein [Anaerolineaceae bacterium]
MKKSKLPDIVIIITAVWAVLRVSGLPGAFHLTIARIMILLLISAFLAGWFFLNRFQPKLSISKKSCSLFFHGCLAAILFSLLLLSGRSWLMTREGILYRMGALILQAVPFLIFLIILCICLCIMLAVRLSGTEQYPLRILLSEDTRIPEGILLLCACAAVFGAFVPLRDNYYPSHDSAIFSYFGQQILRGKMPYTDLWDHKPPLIFYFDAIGLKIGNGSLFGIWILEFLLFYTGALLMNRLLKRFFSEWITLPVLSLGMLHYVRVLDFGNYTEELSLFFVICTLSLYFSEIKQRKPLLSGFLCGLLCGLAFTCKQNTIGCWCSCFVLDLVLYFSSSKKQDLFRQYLRFWLSAAAGFLLVNTIWVVYFAVNDALAAYWDVAFRFNFIYSDKSSDSRLACAWTTLTFLPSVSPFLTVCFLSWVYDFAVLIKKGYRSLTENRHLPCWALIALPIELFFAGLSGMNYQHYFILCLTPAFILLCDALESLTCLIYRKKWLIRTGIVILLCAGTLPLIRVFRDNYMYRTPSSYTKTRDYLLETTDPEQPILVWGSRTAIYVMSGRYAPTAYFNERPLY